MRLRAEPYRLELKRPFRLATGSRGHTDVVYVHLESDGYKAVGEASMPPYLGEGVDSVLAFAKAVNAERLDFRDLTASKQYLDGLRAGNNAAKAAIEMALVSLAAKVDGKTVGDLFEIVDRPIATSYTLGISGGGEMEEKLIEAAPFKTLKLKLGSADDISLLKTFRSLTDKPFSVDVNQGWNDPKRAVEVAGLLGEMGCLFIEQPFAADDIAVHRDLKSKIGIPIFADESIKRLTHLRERYTAFSGVVIKLMKSTGPIEAVEMLREAKRLGLKTVMGCMAESSVSVAMARSIAPLADYTDLDGPFLIKDDPYGKVGYAKGFVSVVGG